MITDKIQLVTSILANAKRELQALRASHPASEYVADLAALQKDVEATEAELRSYKLVIARALWKLALDSGMGYIRIFGHNYEIRLGQESVPFLRGGPRGTGIVTAEELIGKPCFPAHVEDLRQTITEALKLRATECASDLHQLRRIAEQFAALRGLAVGGENKEAPPNEAAQQTG